MTGHVFISYSRDDDAAYVERLADHLKSRGVAVWFDQEIAHGARWHIAIEENINACNAFIVVMTPGARDSVWVNREINEAENLKKPILPLLLAGTRFFRLNDVQYEDVTGGRMPTASFVSQLGGVPDQQRPAPAWVSTQRASAVELLVRHGALSDGEELTIAVPDLVGQDREAIRTWLALDPARSRVRWRNEVDGPIEWEVDHRHYRLIALIRHIIVTATGKPEQAQLDAPTWIHTRNRGTLHRIARALPS